MGIYDAIKSGVEVAHRAGDIEVMEKLLGAQKEALDLFEENRRLKEENAELRRQQDGSERLPLDGKRHSRKGEAPHEGPYCPTCWEEDRRLVLLVVTTDSGGTVYGHCTYCAKTRRPKR